MRVHIKTVIDMETGKIIEQVYYDYDGPVALCDGGGGGGGGGGTGGLGPSAGPPGVPGGATPGGAPGPGLGGVTGPGTSGGVGGGPDFGDEEPEDDYDTVSRTGRNNESSDYEFEGFEVRDVEDIFLSEQEKAMLDEIESNRIKMLTDAINEKVYEIQQEDISNLVARGVLQSDVGAETLSKTRDRASQAIEEGSLAIGTQRMQDELNFLNSKRDFALKEDYLQWDANKFVQGLEWQTGQNALDRELQLSIQKSLEGAAEDANKWGLVGNVIGGALDVLPF